jgi:hypothetical protein
MVQLHESLLHISEHPDHDNSPTSQKIALYSTVLQPWFEKCQMLISAVKLKLVISQHNKHY